MIEWLKDTVAVPRMYLIGLCGLLIADLPFVPSALRGAGVLTAVVLLPWSFVRGQKTRD